MYFPYLRGRQFELIAIRELIENDCISNKIVPIIEPVRASSTLLNTITLCNEKNRQIGFIINPHVGTFAREWTTFNKREQFLEEIKKANVIKVCLVDVKIKERIDNLGKFEAKVEDSIFITKKKDYIDLYKNAIENSKAKFNFMPDDRDYRRGIRDNKVILSDVFPKQDRNSDYPDVAEIMSTDHIYYSEDGYLGFSDYSIVGDQFSDSGFAPYCLAIHMVYFDDKQQLMVRHFKSKSNEDATDPANKFREALEDLLACDEVAKLDTYAVKQFKQMYEDGTYPGLGTIKKLSIMHHIEMINKYLNG